MAYEKTIWKDKIVDLGTGEIIQNGTPVSARNMQKIEDALESHTTSLAENVQQISELENNKANKTEVNLLATEKANQSDLDTFNATLSSRMDSFVAVGATSDNAETVDIRIGADGIARGSAGEAVRAIARGKGLTYFKRFNLFDKSESQVVNLMKNASTGLLFAPTGAIQAVIFKCLPNTTYTVSMWGSNRQKVYLTTDYPTVGVTVNTEITLSQGVVYGGYTRTYNTFTTGVNDNYMVIYFYSDTTTNTVPDTIQIETGSMLTDYKPFDKVNFNELELINDNFTNSTLSYLKEQTMPSAEEVLGNLYSDFINNFIIKEFGTISKGTVVFIDDDGTSGTATATFPLIDTYKIPMTFAIWGTSEIAGADYLTSLKNYIANGCEIAQHYVNDITGQTTEWLTNFFDNQKTLFESLGLPIPKNFVAPYNHTDDNLKLVGSKYFNMMASGNSGIVTKRSKIYALDRTAINVSKGYSYYTNQIDKAIADNTAIIYYFHGRDISTDTNLLNMVKSVIEYAKSSGINITTMQGLYELS